MYRPPSRSGSIIRVACRVDIESVIWQIQIRQRVSQRRKPPSCFRPPTRPYSDWPTDRRSRNRIRDSQAPSFGCRAITTESNGDNDIQREDNAPQRRLNVYDKSDKWQDWFPREEYEDPMGQALEPFEYQPLDNDTRRLIQELQDMYHGVSSTQGGGVDAPVTTQLCNIAIQDLSDLALGGKKLMGRAERAHMILKCMELFYSLPPPNAENEKPWPLPSRQTYFGVLKLFASSTSHFNDRRVPDTCMEIIERIERRYQLKGGWRLQEKELETSGAPLILRPNVVMWNQVFSAWAVCSDPEKAYEAARLLKQLKQKDRSLIDSSSYGHVLRACAFSNTTAESKKLASEVAILVWDDFTNTGGLEPTSYMFTFYLTSCQYISRAPRRDEKVEEAFRKCCEHGMVNAHVIHALKVAATTNLYTKLMEEGIEDFRRQRHLSDSALAQKVPFEWACNSNVQNQFGW